MATGTPFGNKLRSVRPRPRMSLEFFTFTSGHGDAWSAMNTSSPDWKFEPSSRSRNGPVSDRTVPTTGGITGGPTVTDTDESLLAVFGSGTSDVTVAVFVIDPAAEGSTSTTMVRCAVIPGASDPSV